MKQLTDEEFESIMKKHSRTLFIISYNYTRDNYLSEDIVQDAFIKLYRARKSFESDEHIKNWLIRVTINLSLNELKSKKRVQLIDEEYINNLPDTSDYSEKNEEIYNCVCSLKDSFKNVIILYYYDKYSLKEIAKILKISESGVTSRLDRARKKIKEIYYQKEAKK